MTAEMETGLIAVLLGAGVLFTLAGTLLVRGRTLSAEGFLVARNSIGTGLGLATVTASVIGAWVLFGPAEAATWAGLPGLAGYAIGQAAPLLALAVLGPRMRALMPKGHSLSEFAYHRYGRAMYACTVLIMLFYMFVFLAAELTGMALALQLTTGVPLAWTAVLVAAATLIYTVYGGLRASMVTDGLQFALIVPLLLVAALWTLGHLGGRQAALAPVETTHPALLDWSHGAGVEFGLTLVIAILAANLFHQGFWQRVYACRSPRVVRRAFMGGAAAVIPMVFLAGMFGLWAVGNGMPAEDASIALFSLVQSALPAWALYPVLVLALALVMSSMDTLLNGISCTLTSDLARIVPTLRGSRLLRSSRLLTLAAAAAAVLVASQGHSVLYLFLVADLVCAGAVVPLFAGLYTPHLRGPDAACSAVLGIAAGALFFAAPDHSPLLPGLPGAGSFLVSFGLALAISTALTLGFTGLRKRQAAPSFLFDELRGMVSSFEEREEPAA